MTSNKLKAAVQTLGATDVSSYYGPLRENLSLSDDLLSALRNRPSAEHLQTVKRAREDTKVAIREVEKKRQEEDQKHVQDTTYTDQRTGLPRRMSGDPFRSVFGPVRYDLEQRQAALEVMVNVLGRELSPKGLDRLRIRADHWLQRVGVTGT